MNFNSRWSNYPYIEKIAGTGTGGSGTVIDKVNVQITGETGTPSGSGSISGSTLNIVLNDIKGATGEKGEKGDKGDKGADGKSFEIKKTYSSVSEMNSSFANDGLSEGDLVIVSTSDTMEEDNGKIYVKGSESYVFVVDIATAAEAIQGPRGEKGEKGDKGDAGENGINAVISGATATIDNNVGVPSVAVNLGGTESNRTFAFTFQNMKGQPGERGIDGVAATIDEVTATIDSNVGTPKVEVALGGTANARTIGLNFKNLKGETGQQGPAGVQGERGPAGQDGQSAEITEVTASIKTVVGEPTVEVETGGTNLAKTLAFKFGIPSSGSSTGGTTITDVVVNVDNGIGTPSATGSISGTTLTLNFSNLKGSAFNSEGKIEYPNGTLEWIE